ncbi:MAG: adenylosuccinate synthase [Deltaproteobacteria bacterium]|nr:adenylosuccinate synthase [Deltaproteobacteria bacterium]
MATIILVGSQWGDEGKGKVIDIYTEYADAVIRFQGGANAGHTIVIGDQTIILHQIPSGILHPDKLCIIGNGMVLNLETLVDEIDDLHRNGYFPDPSQLLISEEVHLVLPYHRLIDVGKEEQAGAKKIGTTGRGIGPAYEDKVSRKGIRFVDLFDEKVLREKLESNLAEKNPYLVSRLQQPPCDANEIFDAFRGLGERLKPHMANISVVLDRLVKEGKQVLFEGAQGALLDVDHGTYPYVTSSNTVAGAVCAGCGIGPTMIDGVVGVVKAYSTRVGEGPFPTEQLNETGTKLRDRGKEYGATTGRPRRCGWIDIVALKHAMRINGFTSLALTKLDVLSGIETVKIACAYKVNGREIDEFPANSGELASCEPVYEEMPGWDQDISAIRDYDALPPSAKNYIDRLQELLEVEFILVSVGYRRDETIVLENPFA